MFVIGHAFGPTTRGPAGTWWVWRILTATAIQIISFTIPAQGDSDMVS